MAHINSQMTRNVEIGAVRRQEWPTEIVRTDGGNEVRNQRWATPLRAYDVSLPSCIQTNRSIFDSVVQIWEDTSGGVDTFWFYDWVDAELVKVRFDTAPTVTSDAGHLLHMDTFTLQEVRE